MRPNPDALDEVFAYHERTKHFPHRHAASLGYLDWDTQPNPFRRYEGSSLIRLPIPDANRSPAYDDLFSGKRFSPKRLTLETISELFYFSLALSAWKSFKGSTWALRVNPSSGNLHPTEAYILSSRVDGPTGRTALYHYAPEVHALELRCEWPIEFPLPSNGPGVDSIWVGLTSIHWREAWKYGERAYRYCQHDMGHAIAAVRISAALQGWSMVLDDSIDDAVLSRLLGLDRSDEFDPAEREEPAVLARISTSEPSATVAKGTALEVLRHDGAAQWFGRANRLSTEHHPWPVIDGVTAACAVRHPAGRPKPGVRRPLPGLSPNRNLSAAEVIRRRRSAVAMDGSTRLTAEEFFLVLHRVLPMGDRAPWDMMPWPPAIDLVLFVHRVEGLPSGLYCLVRDPARLKVLKESMSDGFRWTKAAGSPVEMPLYLLEEGDVRSDAAAVSCGQDIASDGAFAVAMLAEFEKPLRERGAWFYRRLHWEAGAIGQVLYLEAEAAGVQATGIGCFFDDSLHELIGVEGCRFQTLYHFTVGGAVEDTRLSTLPAYPAPG